MKGFFLLLLFFSSLFQENDFRVERMEMIDKQIKSRGIKDKPTLLSMTKVPRHKFVPPDLIKDAYKDGALPIGHGQTISQPYIVAFMTSVLNLKPEYKVLEIGTGSGYQAAVLAEIVKEVYTIEIIEELHNSAAEKLSKIGYANIKSMHADGFFGWQEYAPFDAIIVTAAAEFIPPPLIEQLKNGGKMIIPVGSPFRTQSLVLVEKNGDDIFTSNLLPVRFVPFTREN
jgi:protein-L-isoaspartate(D-aspartate) O-methyltransferase